MDTISWISKGIKKECERKKMTYYLLAQKSSIPKTTLLNIVNRKIKNPGIYTLEKICEGLDISILYIFETYYIQEKKNE